MKGTSPQSFWLSAANRAAGWWMGHAANAVRQQQSAMMNAALDATTKAATGAKPKRKRRVKRRARR